VKREEIMNVRLEAEVESIIKAAFSYQESRELKEELVASLQRTYKIATKQGDVLIPFSGSTLKDNPIERRKTSGAIKYYLKYKWNEGRNSEFINPQIIESIPEGTVLDRLGKPNGKYVCPVNPKEETYSVAERALPYFFIKLKVISEPSYHRYRAIKTISKNAIIEAIQKDQTVFIKEDAKVMAIEELEREGIIFGQVAPVPSFLAQGVGGGHQYRLPLSVSILIALKFLETVRT